MVLTWSGGPEPYPFPEIAQERRGQHSSYPPDGDGSEMTERWVLMGTFYLRPKLPHIPCVQGEVPAVLPLNTKDSTPGAFAARTQKLLPSPAAKWIEPKSTLLHGASPSSEDVRIFF